MKPYLLCVCLLFALYTSGQKSKLLYYDADWKPAKAKEAIYLMEQKKLTDTCYEWNYYTVGRPRFISLQFKDKDGKIPHGDYTVYRDDGHVDTFGYYNNGKKVDHWIVMAGNNRRLKQLYYEDGVLRSTKDSTRLNEEWKKWTDSLDETSGTFERVEIESEFPGGLKGWQTYLMQNLRYPAPSVDMESQGMIVIQFIVDKQGKIQDPSIIKSVEYNLDKEALRMIVESPNWVPAVQDGKKVRSYKKQPIIFRLERG